MLAEARLHHLRRRCHLILALTAALVATEAAQKLNTPQIQRTNLQLQVLVAFLILRMRIPPLHTPAKIPTKIESLLTPIISN